MSCLLEKYVQPFEKTKTILTTFSGRYTVEDIESQTEFYINHIKSQNIKGKRIGIIIPSIFQFLSLSLAINKLEGIIVPLSHQFRTEDLKAILEFLDPHIIFTVQEYTGFDFKGAIHQWATVNDRITLVYSTQQYLQWDLESFGTKEKPTEEQSMDIILSTSGSTGVPKGIVHSISTLESTILNFLSDVYEIKSSDHLFLNAPPTSYYGFVSIFAVWSVGAEVVIPEAFDIPKIVGLLQETTSNKIVTTPSIIKAIYTFAKQLAPSVILTLELCALAGEFISEELVNEICLPDNCKVVGMYGSSEMGAMMYCEDLRKKIEWTVCKDAIHRKSDSVEDISECLIRTPGAFLGYYNRPDLTAEAWSEDGLFLTGDLIRFNENQRIEIVGRKKDMIKKGGLQVIPGEVELVLMQHEKVKQAVVVGIPHHVYGEQVVAFIVSEDESTLSLQEFCSDKIARYKVPDIFEFVSFIPISQGKVDKITLRNQMLESQKRVTK